MRSLHTLLCSSLLASCYVATFTAAADYVSGVAHDQVVVLDGLSFMTAIKDPANPLWFLKFYAPWCGHCKKLAPVLANVAPDLKGQMAIGTIDCTVHKKLCDKYKVRGYPTLKFSLDGNVQSYPGNRDTKSIKSFANKMSQPAVKPIFNYEDAINFAQEHTEEGVVFVGYDSAATGDSLDDQLQSSPLGQVFAQTARKSKAFAYFLWLAPGAEGLDPFSGDKVFINRVEKDVASRAHKLEGDAPRTEELEKFVAENNVALVSEIGPQNFQKIGNSGRPLAIAIIDPTNADEVATAKQQLKTFITETGPKEVADSYYFSIIDGNRWSKFLEQFDVVQAENPQYLVLDVPSKDYWQNKTFTTIESFMAGVVDGTIQHQTARGAKRKGLLGKIQNMVIDYLPYSVIAIFVLLFLFVYMLVPSGEGLGPDDFDDDLQLDENEGNSSNKAGEQQSAEAKKDK